MYTNTTCIHCCLSNQEIRDVISRFTTQFNQLYVQLSKFTIIVTCVRKVS